MRKNFNDKFPDDEFFNSDVEEILEKCYTSFDNKAEAFQHGKIVVWHRKMNDKIKKTRYVPFNTNKYSKYFENHIVNGHNSGRARQ